MYIGIAHGVLAPNAPLRAAVTALAGAKLPQPTAEIKVFPNKAPSAIVDNTPDPTPAEPLHRKAARYVWTLLLARIYEVLPLVCPRCGGEMRIIAFITEAPAIREILGHLGETSAAPPLAPARGPPLWEWSSASQWETDPQVQPAPDYEFDQRIAW